MCLACVQCAQDPKRSRLRRMVPSVGSFFTPLKLVEAFNEYGEPLPSRSQLIMVESKSAGTAIVTRVPHFIQLHIGMDH